MSKTINALTVTTSAAASDLIPLWRSANGDTRKITKANLIGGVMTGGGTIATGGHGLTLQGSSAINGTFHGNFTGGGTLASGGFTLTAPASGTIVTTDAAQELFAKSMGSIRPHYEILANDALVGLSVWTPFTSGLFFVHNLSNAVLAAFIVRGSLHNVSEQAYDITGQFSNTPNTAGSLNFYWDGTYGYVIQNKTGASIYVGVLAIGAE